VVDLSQVKMNATTHGVDIIRLQKEAKKAALVGNLYSLSTIDQSINQLVPQSPPIYVDINRHVNYTTSSRSHSKQAPMIPT
jgi:hypothetical protein